MPLQLIPPDLAAPGPIADDQLLGLLFLGAMAKQGFKVERAARFLPAPEKVISGRQATHQPAQPQPQPAGRVAVAGSR